MQNIKSKTMAILIVAILTISIGASLIIPTTSAHTPPWNTVSYAYLTVAPSPIGVGQKVGVCMWIDTAIPGASSTPGQSNVVRRENYKLTITAPDGTNTTQTWERISDTTGMQTYYFTPDQIGTYTLTFDYPGQTYHWNSTNTPNLSSTYNQYYGDTYSAARATQAVTVQNEPIQDPAGPALPTEYWTYPINGQNYNWYTIASNWLSTPYIPGANPSYGIPGGYQADGSAPNSAHIMWSNPIQYGGVVGGNNTNIPGEAYYQGGSYNTRFNNPIIMQGTLFFQLPFGETGTGGNYVAWDLKTGKQLWSINASATGVSLVPSFGYLYSMDQPNQHGILPNGALVATTTAYTGQGTTWRFYDPMTGVLTPMIVTNVPTGSNVAGLAGEYLKISLVNYGTTANPNWYLQEWNSSKVFGIFAGTGTSYWYTGTVNASSASAYDWNVSVSLPAGSWSIGTINSGAGPLISLNDKVLLVQGTFGGHVGDFGATVSTDPANITAISLNPSSLGTKLWSQTYQPAPGNNTRTICGWDTTTGIFIFEDKESITHYGFSLATGQQVWGPASVPRTTSSDWNYLSLDQDIVAYGNLYFYGYSGFIYCFDDATGTLEWTFGNGGEGNSTYAGTVTPYGYYPVFISAVADGKIYTTSTEHSPNSPLYTGEELRCINATTGLQIWAISDYGNCMYGGTSPIASGYLVTDNTYDQQIYCYGKGPSAMTIEAPMTDIALGSGLVIRGTITDISAGTKQEAIAANFPNGLPAVSDASQQDWMQYVYMQQPMPNNATGVPITISVIDSNGNYRTIGNTVSTIYGTYSLQWTPDIPGAYTVVAAFGGSESYYPSEAVTTFAVDPAAATPTPTAAPLQSMADQYFIPAVAGIIIAIAIVGAGLALLMVRKRP
jgi:FOG: WD40-like repeat